ncbi:MAG: NAD(P)/FAD-dependent oxidoreductase [Chloroflexi bacterium]|nr:NAD(P)/FAD-dependent oxidoreductase [Chloroflexota bacterium]
MRVGIIGAGAAGLAAAYELAKQGHYTAVYERAPFLGGQASTFDVGGARLEKGYHHWFTSDTDIVDLTIELGLGDRIRWIDSTVGTLVDGRIYDFVTPMDLLKFTAMSLPDRIRLGLMTLYLQRQQDYRKYEDVTADEWLRRYVGKSGYDVFWGPMMRGKFGEEHYREVGMAWVWGKIQTRVKSRGKSMIREKLGYPMGSFGELFDVLAERVRDMGSEVHTSAAVERVEVDDGRARGMEVALDGGDSEMVEFDAVLATTPSYIFPSLVPSLPDDYLARLTGVNYMAAVLIVLVLDRPLSDVYWLNVSDRSIPFVAVIEHTNLIEPEHYGGKHIVYLSNYLTTDNSLYRMDHDELLQEYLPHLRKINPDFDTSWIEDSYHHRVGAAQPIIGTRYSERIPSHRTPFEGLYLANTTQIYPEDRGTNYSVRMGREVARMMMDDQEGE